MAQTQTQYFDAKFSVLYRLDAARDAQVSVVTIHDRGFYEALGPFLAGPRAVPDLTPIHPLALIISNTGTHKIGYVNVRYAYVFRDGTTHPGDITQLRNPLMGDEFLPGSQILIYPGVGTIGNRTSANPKMIRQVAELLAKCSAVEVSLDAVSWDDGTIWGPDQAGIRQRYRSERAAVLDAYLATGGGGTRTGGSDEAFTHTRERVAKYAAGRPEVLKQILDQFAPLKGKN